MEKELTISKSETNNLHEMKQVYAKLLAKDSHGLRKIYHKNPEALFDRITASRDTIFHVAAYKGSEEMLEMLIKLVPSTKKRELLRIKNIHGNTVLHEVVTTDNIKAADLLIRELLLCDGPSSTNNENDVCEREEILADRNKYGETPLFRAAEYGNKMMVMYLAREIERVGDIHKHYTRDDGVSILHIAVLGQHFESAIWLLEKDPRLATYKDNNGKTSLHLLASMATAFKSTSFSEPGLIEGLFYYHVIPSGPCLVESDKLPIVLQTKDFEHADPATNQTDRSKGFNLYCRFLTWLARVWNMIDRIWSQKKLHSSAVKLTKLLVRTDTSWFDSHEPDEDDTICLERNEDDEEEKVKKIAAVRKEWSSEPDTPLFIAASTGIVEIVKEILKEYPQAIEHINQKGQNILHVVTLHRTYKVFDLVNGKKESSRLVRGIDNHGCTILHHAADTKYYQGGTKTTPALKLQQELSWFEAVKNKIPPYFTLHCNKENKTADKLFKDMHEDQLITAQEWVKTTAQSCSTVAVLVATVVFAAVYTAPGGFHQDNDPKKGRPILLDKPLYSFFTVMDVAGLASSLTSLVIFLSILISSLEYEDFLRKVPRDLSFGFTFLFFSVTSTMLTFTATIFLLFDLKKAWTTNLTYAAASLPILIFTLFIFPLYREFFIAAAKSIFDFMMKNLPGNWEFLRIKDDF